MTMTRRHFEALAARISQLPETLDKAQVITAIAQVCQESNHRFKWGQFEEACAPEGQWDTRHALGLSTPSNPWER
jgi:hypothetical protein